MQMIGLVDCLLTDFERILPRRSQKQLWKSKDLKIVDTLRDLTHDPHHFLPKQRRHSCSRTRSRRCKRLMILSGDFSRGSLWDQICLSKRDLITTMRSASQAPSASSLMSKRWLILHPLTTLMSSASNFFFTHWPDCNAEAQPEGNAEMLRELLQMSKL